MISAFGTALAGLERSQRGIQAAAQRIAGMSADGDGSQPPDAARAHETDVYDSSENIHNMDAPDQSTTEVDLAAELVDVLRHKTGYRANAAVIAVADGMLGELLDVIA